MKPSIIVQNFNKGRFVYRAVAGALSQTIPCEIIVGDAQSIDNSLEEINRAVAEAQRGAEHDVRVLVKDTQDNNTMLAATGTTMWLANEAKGDWILQCSSDDYSLPERARVCMEAVAEHPCSIIANTMYFENQGETNRESKSGYPLETGYMKAGEGISKLGYGSVIAGYSREFLNKCGHMMVGDHTPDVLMGWLAALDKGFYVVCDPQHVHVTHADVGNLGFQGKMRAATGENALLLAEANHAQLLFLYDACATYAQELHPEGIDQNDWNHLLNMIFGQTKGLIRARKILNSHKLRPLVLDHT